MQSYDEKQRNAVLRTCPGCQRSYYFTDHQQTICIRCQEQAQQAATWR